ncbi:MAG: hypothetical protein RL204_2190 [Bacteroidota bacterium]
MIPMNEAALRLQEFFDSKQDFWSEVDIKGEFKNPHTFILLLKSQRSYSYFEGTIEANSDQSTLISFKTYISFGIQLFSIIIPLAGIISIFKAISLQIWESLPYAFGTTIVGSFLIYRVSESSKYVLEDRYYRYVHKLLKNPSPPKKVKPE